MVEPYEPTTSWDRSDLDGSFQSSLSWQGLPAGIKMQLWQIAAAVAGSGADAVRCCVFVLFSSSVQLLTTF